MGEARIKARCSNAKKISKAILKNYVLKFNKPSNDDSYKANLSDTSNESDVVYGVIYEINEPQTGLDVADGYRSSQTEEVNPSAKKYAPTNIKVLNEVSGSRDALAYIAPGEETVSNPTIYDWYLHHIISGAKESGLPSEYQRGRYIDS